MISLEQVKSFLKPYKGATSSKSGEKGLVPAPKKDEYDGYYLSSSGKWNKIKYSELLNTPLVYTKSEIDNIIDGVNINIKEDILKSNNTFTGTNIFTKEIRRSSALSSGDTFAFKTVDTNGMGETSFISYYTGSNIYNRMLAKNNTSGKHMYLDVMSNNNGVGSISIGGTVTEKYVNLQGATKVRVPTAGANADELEAVNISYLNTELTTLNTELNTELTTLNTELTTLNTELTKYLPLAGGKMTGTIDFNSRFISNPAAIEFKPLTTATYGGFIDFHYAGATEDYTSRIIEDASGQLTYVGSARFAETSSINSAVLATKGWVNNPTTATNVVHRTGDETIAGTKTFSSTINGTALYANWGDLAEHYKTDYQYPKGTLVQFGGEKEITIADDEVNAVITSQPGVLLNNQMENGQAIALCGRVPVRVIGKVNKFDYLHLSSIPGVAESVKNSEDEYPSSNVIARALESKESSDEGLVLCVVKFEI